jgi:hypothetical protein
MQSTQLADLPAEALQHIISKARSRHIGGTNGYASVSKSWQQASSEEDQEQLRLLVDVSQMSEEQLDSAAEWLGQYGQQVVTMDLCHGKYTNDKEALQPAMQQLFQAAVLREALTSVVLYINHSQYHTCDTLGDLMNLGLQLPNLQHLEASTDLATTWGSNILVATAKQLKAGRPPPMQRLFPALTSLSLDLVPRHDCHEKWDSLLPAVLPNTLQQLQLTSGNAHPRMDLAMDVNKNLSHLPRLRRLGLAYLLLCGQGVPTQVEELQLHFCTMWGPEVGEDAYAVFADKLSRLGEMSEDMECWKEMGVMSKLTAYCSRECGPEAFPDSPLAQHLPHLQKLHLSGVDPELQPVAEQLSGLSSLRSVCFRGHVEDGLLEGLAQVTQLTSLDVADLRQPAPLPQQPPPRRGSGRGRRGAQGRRGRGRGRGRGSGQDQAPREPGAISSMLQQLTGLRQLAVSEEVLLEQGPWLPCLTQLTLLAVGVQVKQVEDMPLWWETISSQLHPWLAARPASLRHLSFMGQHSTFTYSILPSPVPGLGVMCAPVEPGSCWPEQQFRLVQPCPHLPGVMEVLGE